MAGLLDTVQSPADIKSMSVEQLETLAEEMRERIIVAVGKNGGHLASNLGVVELTIALHYCFDFASDRLVFDVGHQCYPHKMLTGRAGQFDTLRQAGGLSGFPKIDESEYDPFNVGHAGTAIATAVGLAKGFDLQKRDNRVVAVVGDASIVNGLAFEGLNQAGTLGRQMLVVLNDNAMGIAPTQGGLAAYMAKFRLSDLYDGMRRRVNKMVERIPGPGKGLIIDALDHLKEGIKATVAPHQIFEQFGFVYVGPCEGHKIRHLIELLQVLRDAQSPVLLHVMTTKGRGYPWATEDPTSFHSPSGFVVSNGKLASSKGRKSWTKAFGDALLDVAERDEKVVALTAAMPDGTGMREFSERYPDRYIDCGLAESCAVDVAAGLAKTGLKPIVGIYSTFLQRGFDQVFQEVSLQGLPVVFCIDRAGMVGGDGAVHHGFLDVTYLRGLPRMVLMAPADEVELRAMLDLALTLPDATAIRYPRDVVPEPILPEVPVVVGKSRRVRRGTDATIVAYGTAVSGALEAAELLELDGLSVGVVNARFARPIDSAMVREVLSIGPVVTAEDHSVVGGFGSGLLEEAVRMGLNASLVHCAGIPADRYIEHGSRMGQLAEVGLDAVGLASKVREMLEPGATPVKPVDVSEILKDEASDVGGASVRRINPEQTVR